ncbi:MAG: cytochrome c [Bacteroidetes bacterium]|nr:cytochrome c [Bacteroidota bacterium]
MTKSFFRYFFCLLLSEAGWTIISAQPVHQNEIWIAPSYADTLRNRVPATELTLKEAKKIYENACWPCHGLSGKGDGPAAATLNPKPADHTSVQIQKQSDGSIFWKISIGKGNMQPYAKALSSRQRWMLVNYIRELGKKNLPKNSTY